MNFLLLQIVNYLEDIKEKSHVYFVHSYKFIPDMKMYYQAKRIIRK